MPTQKNSKLWLSCVFFFSLGRGSVFSCALKAQSLFWPQNFEPSCMFGPLLLPRPITQWFMSSDVLTQNEGVFRQHMERKGGECVWVYMYACLCVFSISPSARQGDQPYVGCLSRPLATALSTEHNRSRCILSADRGGSHHLWGENPALKSH